jgi:hypothetical protein
MKSCEMKDPFPGAARILQSWSVSLVAQNGLQFDLRSAQSKLIASLDGGCGGV